MRVPFSQVADMATYITKNKIRMVVMLDIQGVDIAQAALSVVNSKQDDAGRPRNAGRFETGQRPDARRQGRRPLDGR